MKSFRWSTFAGASLGALVFTFAAPGSATADSFGSSGGGSSGGGSHGSLFAGHGSSGGGSHGSLFAGHGSSGGGSHGSLFAGHGSSGGGSHGSLFAGHGSSGGGSHGSLFAGHGSSGGGSSGGSSHGSSGGGHHPFAGLFSHGSSGGSSHGSSGGGSHGSLFKGHGSSGGGSHGSLFQGHGSSGGGSHGSSGGSYGGTWGGSYVLGSNSGSVVPTTLYVQDTGVVTGSNVVATTPAPSAAVAYLNVNVPADAKVYLQDQLMPLEGTQRRFVSPELPVGSQHVYNVRVDVVRNGQTVSKTTQALVTAGQEIAVSVQLDEKNAKELVATVATVASR
jgi:uncharacterized protein (TIGR03000 family)